MRVGASPCAAATGTPGAAAAPDPSVSCACASKTAAASTARDCGTAWAAAGADAAACLRPREGAGGGGGGGCWVVGSCCVQYSQPQWRWPAAGWWRVEARHGEGGGGRGGCHLSRSSFSTRPRSPLPATSARSMLSSRAIRRTEESRGKRGGGTGWAEEGRSVGSRWWLRLLLACGCAHACVHDCGGCVGRPLPGGAAGGAVPAAGLRVPSARTCW